MSIGTLYTVDGFPLGQRILAIAALGGLQIDLAQGYKHFEDNLKPEFLEKFASGKIPAFEGNDGFTLFEATAIARYIASLAPNANLLGTSPQDAALVDQWVSFGNSEIAAHMVVIIGMLRHRVAYHKGIEQLTHERLTRSFSTLNKYLSTRTYLVGERITLADVHVASVLILLFKITFDAAARAKYPHLTRHFETIINQPKLKPIFGDIPFVERAEQYVAPAKPKKEEKPKETPKPKAEKPKAVEPEDDEEEEEEIIKEEPKPKNPLDSLPKSSFNLEDFKRAYSNMDTRGEGGSLNWFYDRFDKEGFSIWRVDFKYNDELTQVFMSSNQIGGFFNRLEASRKYLFGSMGVLGKANDSIISGVFIARGPEIQPVVEAAPDWESYTYERLNPFVDGPQKEFFEAAMAWELEIDGKKWADGKNFK